MRRLRPPVDIDANLEKYLAARSPTHRYASFDYCFNYFRSHWEAGRTALLAESRTMEVACLHLGFYLASWGMYRGSTKLLRASLKQLAPVVEVIAASPQDVWAVDSNDYSGEATTLLLDVAHRLRSALPPPATDTLVTKIMLGAFGCVPAFDTYFRYGSGLNRFNPAALRWITSFYQANADAIDRHRVPTIDFDTGADTGRLYTRAKVIDMIFFVEGSI